MIFLSEVIRRLQEDKEKYGDILVVTACQIQPDTVDFRYSIESFFNKDKTVEIKAVVVKGYRE